jgi:tetratricopeptide (TPR) repeat protein
MTPVTASCIVALVSWLMGCVPLLAQKNCTAQQTNGWIIEGTVRDSAGSPVHDAVVRLQATDGRTVQETKTDVGGRFATRSPVPGTYVLRIEKRGFRELSQSMNLISREKHFDFVLTLSGSEVVKNQSQSTTEKMQLDDKSDFTIAGITDWTAAGGHGSDANLRTGESLAKETHALESNASIEQSARMPSEAENGLRDALVRNPADFKVKRELAGLYLRSHREHEALPLLEAAYRINPRDHENGYDLVLAYKIIGDLGKARQYATEILANSESADLHRLLGDIDEQTNDPLTAVREYERAVKLDPSDQHYFAWGAELLVHRAIQPALEVFRNASRAFPKSERILEGLGAALYASGLYESAAQRLCEASDLRPADPKPYLFLGKMQQVSSQLLPCVEEKMSRFAHAQPENALANYYYAVALWKQESASGKGANYLRIEELLAKAVQEDPKCAEAYLQLGIMYSARGDGAQAAGAYRKAIEANSNLAEAHFRLAQSYKRIGAAEKASHEFHEFERIQKTEVAAIEQQRREVRQFVVVLKDQSYISPSPAH